MTKQQDESLLGKIAGYSEILAKDPHSTVFVPLSDAYRRAGRLDEALEVALAGVQALPWFCPGFVVLGRAHFVLGNLNEALRAFNKALILDGESLTALKGLAGVFCRKNQLQPARQVLERARKLYPDNSSIRHMLSRMQAPGGEEEPEAEPADVEQPIATVTIAELFVKQGLLSQACQVFRDILQAEPENETVRQRLAALEREQAGDDREPEEGPEQAKAQPVDPVPDLPVKDTATGEALAVLQCWLATIHRRRQEHVS
jgi:tetratricopeptide (TPR) repeat protein